MHFEWHKLVPTTYGLLNQRLKSQILNTDPPAKAHPRARDATSSQWNANRSLWGGFVSWTELGLLPLDLPTSPTGRERQSLHVKKLRCEPCMMGASTKDSEAGSCRDTRSQRDDTVGSWLWPQCPPPQLLSPRDRQSPYVSNIPLQSYLSWAHP